jgi:histidyl-tRNA synthetase
VPACGLSLGLERIIVVMAERGMFPASVQQPAAQALVAQWSAETAGEALGIARELRSAGLSAEVFPEADKLGKQFRYAGSRSIPYVVVCGDDERARGEVSIKDMAQGVQASVPRGDAASWLRARLGPEPLA